MTEEKLVRGIGRWDLTAIVINTIIGAGIFGLPSQVTALIGGYSLVAFFACAIIIGLIVLCFAEVGSRFTETGGSYLYAKRAFGSLVGFEVGWLYWVARVLTGAANVGLFVSYIGFFFPRATETAPRIAIIATVILILTVVNFIGVRQSAFVTNVFTVGKLVPLIIFVAIGLFFIQPANIAFGAMPATGDFSAAVLILLYAFVGFEAAVIPTGEMKNPQKTLPFALLTALGVVAALYILIQIVCLGNLPELAKSQRPLADAANQFMGAFGASFIAVGALVSIFGNLNSGLLTASRLPFAMAEQGELPGALARTHPQFKTPFVSLVVTSIVILVFAVLFSFLTALTIATIARLLVYATTCGALPVFRSRADAPPAGFVAPLGMFAAFASLALIVWLLFSVKSGELIVLGVSIAVGLVVYWLCQQFGKKEAITESSM